MTWKIDIAGGTFREREVSAGDVAIFGELMADDTWDSLDPMGSPRSLIAWTVIAMSHITKTDTNKCLPLVYAQPMERLILGFTGNEVAEPVEPEPVEPDGSVPQSVIDGVIRGGRRGGNTV